MRPEDRLPVPEKREEVTTEGGLDVAGREAQDERMRRGSCKLPASGLSLFVRPDLRQIAAAVRTGAAMVELHTGCFANAEGAARRQEVARLSEAAEAARAGDCKSMPATG